MMDTIGRRIKVGRETLGLTQAQFAKVLDVSSTNTIYRWESGVAFPPADMLGLIEEKFGIRAGWIVSGEGPMKKEDQDYSELVPVNQNLLQQVLEGVENGLKRRRLELEPATKARLIILLYDHFNELKKEVALETVERYLQLVS